MHFLEGRQVSKPTFEKSTLANINVLASPRTETQRPEGPIDVSDLDQSEQAALWIKKPLYYTHHRKPGREQLSQTLRLPSMHRNVQFSASEGASWECIANNAFLASQRFPGKPLNIVVLLYCLPCNPFNLVDVDVLKRARASLETLNGVAVVGALVVPTSDEALKEQGLSQDQRLPFTLRRDLSRTVLQTAREDSWVVVDTCLGTAPDQTQAEGCMRSVAGSIAPFVSVYARGRLHGRQHEIRVMEVRSQDPIEGPRASQPYDQLHVGSGKSARNPGLSHGPDGAKPGLAAISTLIVDVPKQSPCDDFIWSAVKQPQDRQFFQALERFCGFNGAKMIADWAINTRSGEQKRKSMLLIR